MTYGVRAGILGLFPLWALLTAACQGDQRYEEAGGRGNYKIVEHRSFRSCGGEPEIISDERCVQVLPTLDSLWLQNCDREQAQLDLAVELWPEGKEFSLTRIDTTSCVDVCLGGVSTGCTTNCPSGRSCDANALDFRARLDLDARRLHLEIKKHDLVRVPMDAGAVCGPGLVMSSAIAAPCVQRDVFEADWMGWSGTR